MLKNFRQNLKYPEVKGNLLLFATSAAAAIYLESLQADPDCLKKFSEFTVFHLQDYTALMASASIGSLFQDMKYDPYVDKERTIKDDILHAILTTSFWTYDEFTNNIRGFFDKKLVADTNYTDIEMFIGGSATVVLANHIFRNHKEIGKNIKETAKEFIENMKDSDIVKWLDKITSKGREI